MRIPSRNRHADSHKEKATRKARVTVGKTPEKAYRVTWDGAVILEDPRAYFEGSSAVKKHLDFLQRHKERLARQSAKFR